MARSPAPRMPDEDPDAWPAAPPAAGPAHRTAKPPAPQETFISWRTLVIGAVVAVAVAIGGILFARSIARDPPGRTSTPAGDLPLVEAPAEPWRSRPDDPGGVAVEGTDRALYDAGEGEDPIGQIALGEPPAEPEPRAEAAPPPRDLLEQTQGAEAGDVAVLDEPATGALPPAAPLPAASPPAGDRAGQRSVDRAGQPAPARDASGAVRSASGPPAAERPATARSAPAGEPVRGAAAPAPAASGTAGPATGGPALQLGAFSSREAARDAWRAFSDRFGYLAGLEPVFERVEREGQTLWRLRATGTGSAARARDLCARLRVAGEDCLVVGG